MKTDEKKLVAIVCSTGGPKSLQQVIPLLPANLDAPVVIVQHMPRGFTKSLADRLNECSAVTVQEAREGDVLQKGNVYIACGGLHLKIRKGRNGKHSVYYTEEPLREGVRPCGNYMYESLADSDYNKIVCVVMTGMGADGTKGIQYLKETKPVFVITQDKESSVVYGMPKSIADHDMADLEVPLSKIADAITAQIGTH